MINGIAKSLNYAYTFVFFTDIACFDLCALGQDCVIEIMAVLQKNPEILCLDKTWRFV